MVDKRNIVIKVSYPLSGKATETSSPRVITEWNVKRISIAFGVLMLILVSSLLVLHGADQQNEPVASSNILVSEKEQGDTH